MSTYIHVFLSLLGSWYMITCKGELQDYCFPSLTRRNISCGDKQLLRIGGEITMANTTGNCTSKHLKEDCHRTYTSIDSLKYFGCTGKRNCTLEPTLKFDPSNSSARDRKCPKEMKANAMHLQYECVPETYLRSICSRYTHTGTGANLGKIYFTSPNYPNLIEASDQECYCDIEAFFKNSISLFNMDMYDACKKGAVQIYDGQGNRVAMDCESTTLASVKNKIEIVYNRNCTTSPFWLDFREVSPLDNIIILGLNISCGIRNANTRCREESTGSFTTSLPTRTNIPMMSTQFTTRKTPNKRDGKNPKEALLYGAIGGGVAGGVLLICVIIVIVCCCRRRSRPQKPPAPAMTAILSTPLPPPGEDNYGYDKDDGTYNYAYDHRSVNTFLDKTKQNAYLQEHPKPDPVYAELENPAEYQVNGSNIKSDESERQLDIDKKGGYALPDDLDQPPGGGRQELTQQPVKHEYDTPADTVPPGGRRHELTQQPAKHEYDTPADMVSFSTFGNVKLKRDNTQYAVPFEVAPPSGASPNHPTKQFTEAVPYGVTFLSNRDNGEDTAVHIHEGSVEDVKMIYNDLYVKS